MGKDPDWFFEPRLRFGIRKPSDWRFVPPAWSPVAHLKNRGGDEAPDWVRYSKLPFVTMMGDHDSQHHPYPTVNVGCRPGTPGPDFDFRQLQDQFIEMFRMQHEEVEILDRSPESAVDGCRALYMRSRYLLGFERDGLDFVEPVLSRSYTIFGDGLVFTMGMTSSADTAYFREEDFDLVLRSVRIGARAGA